MTMTLFDGRNTTRNPTAVWSVPNDEFFRLTTFSVDFRAADRMDWGAQPWLNYPTLCKAKVSNWRNGRQWEDDDDRLGHLAHAIVSHPGINEIEFSHSSMGDNDLNVLWEALAEKRLPASLVFQHCEMGVVAREVLRRILSHSNMLEKLQFQACRLQDEAVHHHIAEGLRASQSLKLFEFCRLEPPVPIMMGLSSMMTSMNCNSNLTDLVLTLNSPMQWSLFRAAQNLPRLAVLRIIFSTINIQNMETTMLACFVIQSLKTLDLSFSSIDIDALECLIRALSSHPIIDTLSLLAMELRPFGSIPVNLGNLQVKKLDLERVRFQQPALLQMMDSITASHHNNSIPNVCRIQHLDLGNVMLKFTPRAMDIICNDWLRHNVGPSELVLQAVHESMNSLIQALQQNSSLKVLIISDLDEPCLLAFARGLAHMRGLWQLSFGGFRNPYTNEFFQALEDSLEENLTLLNLSMDGVAVDGTRFQKNLRSIRRLVTINRAGRQLLAVPDIPAGLWAFYLAKASKDDPDGIFFVLTEKPDLVRCMPTSRKRKERG